MKERLWRALPALCGVLAFLALVAPALDPSVQLFYRDTGRLYYPIKKVIAERLAHGQLALWDPWTESGVSLLGQTTPALLHPATLLYAVLPFELAFKLNHLLALLLAGAGAFLLARRLGATRWSSLIAGVVYGGCGYLVAMAASNLPFALGPATVPLAVERLLAFLEDRRPGKLLQAAIVLALCSYAGDPQSMLLAGLIGSAWAVSRPLARGAVREAARAGVLTLTWGLVALLLTAPVALPAVSMLRRSDRKAGISALERTRFYVAPARFAGLFVGRAFDDAPELIAENAQQRRDMVQDVSIFTEYFGGQDNAAFSTTIYVGLAALLLAGFAAGTRRGLFLLLGALVLLLGAGGEAFGVQEWMIRLVPGFRFFRYAEKLLAPASLLLALAAALGADVAFGSPRKRRQLFAVAATLSGLSFAGAALLERNHAAALAALIERGARHSAEAAGLFLSALVPHLVKEAQLAALIALLGLAAWLRPRVRGLRAVAAGVCAAGSILANGPHLTTIDLAVFHEPPALAHDLEVRAGPSEGRWRLYVHPAQLFPLGDFDRKSFDAAGLRASLRPQAESTFHIEGVSSYFSADDPHYSKMIESAGQVLLPVLATRFFVVMPHFVTDREAAKFGFERVSYGMWARSMKPGPRTWLMDRATLVPDLDAAVKRLTASGFDPWREAVLLPPARDLAAVPKAVAGPTGRVRFTRPSPERFEIDVDAAAPTLLGVSEHFDPGWRALVDGNPAPAAELDGAVIAVPVPAGRHHVSLRFWPEGFGWGIALAALTCALILSWRALTNLVGERTKSVTRQETPAESPS